MKNCKRGGIKMKKCIVIGIILLFIGVGFQPVFAEESLPITLKREEDCFKCQVSDEYNLLKVKLLMYKVRVIVNIVLLSKLGKIPEIKENCQEILDVINSENSLGESPICNVLFPLVFIGRFLAMTLPIIKPFGYMILAILHPIGYLLDCFWFPP